MADDFADQVLRAVFDGMHEEYAKRVADVVRDKGLNSADDVEITTETDDPSMNIDVASVRRRANQILGL